MIVKHFGCTTIHNKALYKCIIHSFIHKLSPSTLKVYVAAITAHHDPIEGRSVGKHNLVVRFIRGARRLNPPRPPSLPSWDLALDYVTETLFSLQKMYKSQFQLTNVILLWKEKKSSFMLKIVYELSHTVCPYCFLKQ